MRRIRRGWRIAGAAALVLLAAAGVLLYRPDLFWRLPALHGSAWAATAPSSLILDQDGRLLYEIIDPHGGMSRPVTLDEIPLTLQQAIIATEDASFYRNPGVDLRAVARALWANLRSGEIVSGGSTITQQVARNLLMAPDERTERTWQRKAREAWLAYTLTRSLSKDEILALYLNETYFGNMAYGVEAAARRYFAKPAAQLDLAECALLAGLPQSPGGYDPLTQPEAAKARQRVVLDLMVQAGYVSATAADRAYREDLAYAGEPFAIEAPHFSMLVRQQLAEELGEETVRAGGLRIYTTLDLDLQRAAEDQVRRHLAALAESEPGEPAHNVHNAAVVVMDPESGAVRAMVGSPDYFDAAIDGAVNAAVAPRQSGSAIKPLTYAAAFERGYSPASMFVDVSTAFTTREGRPYTPVNYDYRDHGPVLLRQALGSSYNIVAVKLLDRIGIPALADMAARLGLPELGREDCQGLAMTLGSCEVPLTRLTAAYAALANGGDRVAPQYIERVETAAGEVIWSATPTRTPVLDPRVAYLITDVLADDDARATTFGQNSVLSLPFAAAVKTGTTTDWRDNWTVGYTPDVVVGVWVGNADNAPMEQVSGVTGAAPIWRGVMLAAQETPPADWARPDGLLEVEVCAESGLLPGPACIHRRTELFLAENVPAETCAMHAWATLDARTGQLATDDTPAERRVTRRVTYWPAEALLWAEREGLDLAPAVPVNAAAADDGAMVGAADDGAMVGAAAETAAQGGTPQAALWLASPAPNGRYALDAALPAAAQRLAVEAVAAVDVQWLELWIDGSLAHRWTEPPYRYYWPLEAGAHEFALRGADDTANVLASDPLSISVRAEQAERISP